MAGQYWRKKWPSEYWCEDARDASKERLWFLFALNQSRERGGNVTVREVWKSTDVLRSKLPSDTVPADTEHSSDEELPKNAPAPPPAGRAARRTRARPADQRDDPNTYLQHPRLVPPPRQHQREGEQRPRQHAREGEQLPRQHQGEGEHLPHQHQRPGASTEQEPYGESAYPEPSYEASIKHLWPPASPFHPDFKAAKRSKTT